MLVMATSNSQATSPQAGDKPTPTIATATLGPAPQVVPSAAPLFPLGPSATPKATNCGQKDKAAIATVLETWSSAVLNKNPVRALSIYTEDALLKPLRQAKSIAGRTDIRAHYTRDLKPDQALLLTGITARVDCTEATVVGSFGFARAQAIKTAAASAEIDPRTTPHRFRMRLVAQNGEWMVQEHALITADGEAEHRIKMQQAGPKGPANQAGIAPVAGGQSRVDATFTWSSLVSIK